jgi:hypothetical protein
MFMVLRKFFLCSTFVPEIISKSKFYVNENF